VIGSVGQSHDGLLPDPAPLQLDYDYTRPRRQERCYSFVDDENAMTPAACLLSTRGGRSGQVGLHRPARPSHKLVAAAVHYKHVPSSYGRRTGRRIYLRDAFTTWKRNDILRQPAPVSH